MIKEEVHTANSQNMWKLWKTVSDGYHEKLECYRKNPTIFCNENFVLYGLMNDF